VCARTAVPQTSHNDPSGNFHVSLPSHSVALVTQGCTKKPESYPMTAFRVDYRTWNCQQLADEASLLHDGLAVASEQRAVVTVAHLKAQTEAVRKARIVKECIRS
jgi:hypothetical protein